MTKVSGYELDSKLERQLVGNLWKLLGSVGEKDAEKFFSRFFTPTEILMFSKRLEILKRLIKKQSYSEIKTDLKVTNITVSRMSNLLHRSRDTFLSILARLGSG